LKLVSTERGVQFEIVRNNPDDVHSDCSVRAEIATRFGNFSGQNTAVHLSGFNTFLEQFDEFLKTRRGEVVLQMTEDNAKTSPLVFKGEFPLDGEYLTQLRSDFRSLADHESA
jgi:hypothetical protein